MTPQQLDEAMNQLNKKVNTQRERIELLTTAIHQLYKDSEKIVQLIATHKEQDEKKDAEKNQHPSKSQN